MATLIQTPDNLSLLRNLKHFIIESASEITFRLDKGAPSCGLKPTIQMPTTALI